MQTKNLFLMEDTIFRQCGLYTMWTCLYIVNLAVLFVDDTKGPSRDFNVITNGLSVIYCGLSSANVIFGNKLPSTMLLIGGPIHQYLFWMLFAYFGGSSVLGSHPIGSFNWLSLFVVGLFTLDMMVKTWFLSVNPDSYLKYIKDSKKDQQLVLLEEGFNVAGNHQKVFAKFTFKDGKLDEFKSILNDPKDGLNFTKSCEGYINIECLQDDANPNVLVLSQKWKTKENHLDYLVKRTEMGLFDKLETMLASPPEILYVNNI